MTREDLKEIIDFIAEYSVYLLGCGVHTSRVIRNSKRIAESQNVDLQIFVSNLSLIVTVTDKNSSEFITKIVNVKHLPISFKRNSDLSALSWESIDEHLSLDAIKERFDRFSSMARFDYRYVTVLVSLANGSFCKLFMGDDIAAFIVFIATLIGFTLRRFMQSKQINNIITVSIVSFVSSIISSVAIFTSSTTAEIALATSPLFLVPGVPLINGMIDIFEGHILFGFSRLVNATLIIISIAIGLSATLLIVKGSLV